MKRIFLLVALLIAATFVYTISLAQYISFTTIIDVLPHNVFIYATLIFLWLLALAVTIRIILKQTYAFHKSHWIIIMLLNPILGLLFYGIFARDFATRKFKKTRPLIATKAFLGLEEKTNPNFENHAFGPIFDYARKTTGRSVYEGDTHVEVLNNGDEFFPCLIENLEQAKHSILMEFYIIKTDTIGKRVLDILKEKAESGLDVYLIYDHFGSNNHLDRTYMREIENSGVNVGVFDPQTISIINSNLNFRNHRKAIVIDGWIGFIGGMNLGDEYNHDSKKFGFWRDTHLLVRGNGVTGIQNVFVKDWYYIHDDVLDVPLDTTGEDQPGLFTVIESGPDFEDSLIRDVYLKMISSAKQSVKIVTPYLIIEPELMIAIKLAVKSGVEVTLLLPGKSDYVTVGFATRSYYERLLELGVNIYEYEDTFVHAKVLIVDDEIASVGSVNIDPRSFHLNFEVTAIFENDAVDTLVATYEDDLRKSKKIDADIWKERGIFIKLLQGIFSLFSPIF